jgi:hypothetical protein
MKNLYALGGQVIALWGNVAVPKRREIVAGLRIHGSAGGRDLGRRRLFGGVELIMRLPLRDACVI